jgi:hypothetical protein
MPLHRLPAAARIWDDETGERAQHKACLLLPDSITPLTLLPYAQDRFITSSYDTNTVSGGNSDPM